MIQSDTNHAMHSDPQNRNKVEQDCDGTWLLITSTLGLTLGYVRIDDHDHDLSLSEIRAMISDKLKDNTEYCHGFNFGTGWPLRIVNKNEEHNVAAKNVLPSVSVLSAQSAQHIVNTNNPISAATAIQYGMTPNILNMNYSGNLQPLPISALFTPIHQLTSSNSINKIASSAQYYSPNTVALLQPHQNIKTEQPKIPSLPPFSPPLLSQQELDQKAMVQKQKLQNLLPSNAKTEKAKTPKNTDSKSKSKSKAMLPRLKPVGTDGQLIETSETNNNNKKKAAFQPMLCPDLQAQKDLYCPECEEKYNTDRGYRLHMIQQHQIKLSRGRNKERRFKCDHKGCNRSFYQSSDLRRHQRVHLGVKPFKCSLCSKEFTQRGSLYRHIKTSHKGRDPKTLIILQTEETLPTGQKSKAQTKKSETNDLPPQVNDNDLPPRVDTDDVGVPPPLSAMDNDESMTQTKPN